MLVPLTGQPVNGIDLPTADTTKVPQSGDASLLPGAIQRGRAGSPESQIKSKQRRKLCHFFIHAARKPRHLRSDEWLGLLPTIGARSYRVTTCAAFLL